MLDAFKQTIGRPARRQSPEPRIRVLHVIDNLYAGGAQSVLLALVRLLDHTRFDVYVASLGGQDEPLARMIRASSRELIPIRHRSLSDVRSLGALARVICSRRIQLVHTHLTEADIQGGIVARALRRPLVTTLHSVVGDRASYSRPRRIAARLAAAHLPRRLLAVSTAVADSHANELGRRAGRIRVVSNVPVAPLLLPESFDRERKRNDLGLRGPVVSTTSRLTEARDHETLIRALPSIVLSHPTLSVLILSEGVRQEPLGRLVRELDLGETVRFLGTRFDAAEIVAASDILCQPTLHEGLPISVLDAMSLGVPVIASAVDGTRELIEDGHSGLLVPPRDAEALADAIGELLADPARARRLAHAARETIERDYDTSSWVAAIESTYCDVMRKEARCE